jgi:large conductance mechanosensitive channel
MNRIVELKERVGEKAGGFFSEFWKFAAKGNVFDLAIGVVLGTAFTQVVNSLVTDIIGPFLALLTGGVNFTEWSYTMREATMIGGKEVAPLVINYGHLIQVSVNFFVVGIAIFVFYKLFMNLRKRIARGEEKEASTPISTEEQLLCEIRDLLKEQTQGRTQ